MGVARDRALTQLCNNILTQLLCVEMEVTRHRVLTHLIQTYNEIIHPTVEMKYSVSGHREKAC